MAEEEKALMTGAFVDSLKRNNKQIKDDRAEAIVEDAEMAFSRKIQDMERDIKRLVRARDNMLDLSPDNSLSLMLASDFDGEKFASEELKMAMTLRNKEIELELLQNRYKLLFGGA